MRETDATVFRLGGDEYAIVLPGALRAQAIEMGERALRAVRGYAIQPRGKRPISNFTASVGIALYPFHGIDMASLLGNVDFALYQAKGDGRNRISLYDQDATNLRNTTRRVYWARHLREALDRGRILLYAQPTIRLADHSPMHSEVLARIVDDGWVENVYRLQVMNATEAPQRYRIEASGLPGLTLSQATTVDLGPAEARWVAVALRMPPSAAQQLKPGAHPMQWRISRITDGANEAIAEKSTFVLPR